MPLSTENLQRAWRNFKVHRDPDCRVDLINHYSYLVKITAGRLVTSLPGGVEREDVISAGVIGLIRSVDQFDPSRDVKFETYAIALVRGAILEMLREEDWVPRSMREKMRAIEKASTALEIRRGRTASEAELSEVVGLPVQEISEIQARMSRTSVYSLDDMLGSDGEESVHFIDLIVDEAANTSGEVEGREIRRILVSSIDRLPERERLVIALYYHQGLTFREIGKVVEVSESRVYQLHTQAMTRLRGHLRSQVLPDED
ncbi:RNA polymerase sigma factor WhiG [soil metagenome]